MKLTFEWDEVKAKENLIKLVSVLIFGFLTPD